MTAHIAGGLRAIDLKDPDLYVAGVPHEAFAWLRANDPVYWNPEVDGAGFWAVTRHADVVTVSNDPETYSSAKANGGYRLFNENELAVTGKSDDGAIEASMISMDPPEHLAYRRMVMGGFTPPRLRDMEAAIRRGAVNLIEAMIERRRRDAGPMDFVSAFSAPYAIATLAELFGVSDADGDKLFEWSNAVVGEDDPELRASPDYMMESLGEMARYAMGLWVERERAPGGDLISMLVDGARNGMAMNVPRYIGTFILLVVAGDETTRNSISGGLIALTENPDQRASLIADASLATHAAQEIVRFISPVLHMRRTATRDVVLGGKQIRARDKVVVWYPAANRDPDVFPDPDRFDIARTARPAGAKHVGFGTGEHVCLGQRLAELQLRVAFEELFARLPDLRPVGPPRRLRSNFINGIKELPVTF